jgi:hypothetical protein
MFISNQKDGFSVKAYPGDAKTLLAFDIPQDQTKDLAGFTIAYTPHGGQTYVLVNDLQFPKAGAAAQAGATPASPGAAAVHAPQSTAVAPIQKFRWVHVPGDFHQIGSVTYGNYTYAVTPRYFSAPGVLKPLDPSLSVSLTIPVQPFVKGNLQLGFTRGFVQSQAFVNHFGAGALLKPHNPSLLWDTNTIAATNAGQSYTFAQEYAWSGFTARTMIFGFLNEVLQDKTQVLNMLAYDLDEPDILKILLQLAQQGRISLIVDDSATHHNAAGTKPEDEFEVQFNKVKTGSAWLQRGHFARYQHNKILIAKRNGKGLKVLTGSTNFSMTGMYVNSNHVVQFNDPTVAQIYSDTFAEMWNDRVSEKAFVASGRSTASFALSPVISVTFAPHSPTVAAANLNKITQRVDTETSSVLFAVMDTGPTSGGTLIPALIALHKDQKIYNAGISDSTNNISLYKPNDPAGLAVTGKPAKVLLPPPFNKEASIGMDHQVHDKFVVCGFNTASAVVWCGSSNLALGGEEQNGDNLIEIQDMDIAVAFAIEALDLIDHFMFLDEHASGGSSASGGSHASGSAASPQEVYLSTTDAWTTSYFDVNDYHMRERLLFH